MSALTRRELLLSLPGLAVATRLLAQTAPQPLRVRGLSQVTLAVSDIDRSLAFYQGLFGLPIQARHGSAVLLRLGSGPRFVALTEAGAAPPRIDHWGVAVEGLRRRRCRGEAERAGRHARERWTGAERWGDAREGHDTGRHP